MTHSGTLRRNRRGGILGTAMLFFVMVTVAGTAILSMSVITKLKLVRQSIDVRLLIAAEAGIESVRGRFTLVAGVQEDWTGIMPVAGWNDVGAPMTINGISVQAQAMSIGDPSNLQARIRAVATANQHSRAVEYDIQAANFADYALYFGSSNTVGIGSYFKMVGNIYAVGSINLSNRDGIEFFGDVDTSEQVLNAPDPAYNFKKGYTEFVPVVTIPAAAYGLDPMRNAAIASDTLFYANTLSIELVGEQFVRTYEFRISGTGSNYNQNEYEIRTETIDIPDNSVIYIENDKAPPDTDSYSQLSTQANQASTNNLDLWGVLDERRVTIACEHFVSVTNNVAYQTLLDDPDLRRFTEKKGDDALAFREMLGVLSYEDIDFETTMWTPLTNAQEVTDNATLNPPDVGHLGLQYCLDGVFMGVGKAARTAVGPSSGKELWVCGGIINLTYPSTLLASNFDRRNYDTDFRLKFNTPPYFLRAYNETANMIPGTWRTYEL